MTRLSLAASLLLCGLPLVAKADSITYSVLIDTSSQSSNQGYIDLQLNGGTLPPADIMASVTGFAGAVLNSSDPGNDAINTVGSLPGTVTFDNQSGNDYFEALTFGSSVSFLVTLSGPGVSSSGGATSLSGTTFQISFYDPLVTTPLFTTDPSGAVAALNVDSTGGSASDSQPAATVADIPSTVTPEPTSFSLLMLGGGLMGLVCFRGLRNRTASGS